MYENDTFCEKKTEWHNTSITIKHFSVALLLDTGMDPPPKKYKFSAIKREPCRNQLRGHFGIERVGLFRF